jgi:bacterial leucyl aminopeptidase
MLDFKKIGGSVASGLLLFTTNVSAETHHQQLVMPNCLVTKMGAQFDVLAKNNQLSVIDIPSSEIDNLAKLAAKNECGRFIDVSRHFVRKSLVAKDNQAQNILLKYGQTPKYFHAQTYRIQHQHDVNGLISKVNSENIWNTLSHLTSYYNRSATKDTGVETANWLKNQFDTMAKEYSRTDVNSYFVKTGWYYKQPSVVTVIGKDIKADAVVIGAHMDTLDGNMPGAGDDGSGSSSVMEMARVLLSSEKALKHPVYIIWYSAEERGLVGSGYVVQDFLDKNIPVKAAIQFDMTGFRNDANDRTMWVYTDYVDSQLTEFMANLIKEYVKVDVNYSRCGYGCSDHASWHYEGIPAAFPCETDFKKHNPYIHSSRDKIELMSLDHMTNFSKLGVAFAVELAS